MYISCTNFTRAPLFRGLGVCGAANEGRNKKKFKITRSLIGGLPAHSNYVYRRRK